MLTTRWLITGGCGFIGRRLVEMLRRCDKTCSIRVLDDLSVGNIECLRVLADVHEPDLASGVLPELAPGDVQFIRGDVKDRVVLDLVTYGVDVVVHLAANTGVAPSVEDPRSDCANNVIGTLNALESARRFGVQRFIFASSGAPVGDVTPPLNENVAPRPASPYGASKLAGEGYCSAYARTFGVEAVILRFGNVYGPGSQHKSSVVAKFIRDAIESGVLHINGDGSQTRDFLYIDDLVEAVCAASRAKNVAGETFHIATARETSIMELVRVMSEKLVQRGLRAPRVIYEKKRKGDVMRNYAETTKAGRLLMWRSKTSIEQGIEQTLEWFLSRDSNHGVHQMMVTVEST